ncbi:MAG: hypothetical protein GWP19_04985 [Planctomycetia bacterium]|nr:hypothetical protein [Planctomycetia bacterium]
MNIIYIVLITTFVTILVYEGIKWLYSYISRGLRRYFVHHRHFDECWKTTEDKILGLEKRHSEKIAKIELRLEESDFDNTFKHFVDCKFKKLEGRQRQYDIYLFKQGKLISDLQVAQSKNLDRFKKTMDLENIKVR